MNLWRRAYLYTVRKKGKSVLMLLILLMMSTMMLTCLSIQSASDKAALDIRKALTGGFTINATHLNDFLDGSAVARILKTAGVLADFNARSYYRAEYRREDGSKLAIKEDGAAKPLAGDAHTGKIIAQVRSVQDAYFTKSGFKLIQGRHILQSDKNVILISDDFADRNSLKLGDRIILAEHDLNRQVKVQIIGIFTPTEEMESTEMTPPELLYENIGFTDQGTYSQLYFDDGKNHYQYGDFGVEDPAQLDTVVSKIKKIPNVNWKDSTIAKEDADYRNARLQLTALQDLTTTIVTILIVISISLLAVILLLWERNRIPEIGMMLAMGISKGSILLQHMMEMLSIAILSFGLSFFTSSLMAQTVGNTLFEQATAEERLTNTLDSIQIVITFSDLLLVYVIGTGILLLSVILASYPVMRLKPKQILTKMS